MSMTRRCALLKCCAFWAGKESMLGLFKRGRCAVAPGFLFPALGVVPQCSTHDVCNGSARGTRPEAISHVQIKDTMKSMKHSVKHAAHKVHHVGHKITHPNENK